MIITKLQVAPVELVVSSESSCAVRLARHSQNAWARHVECVESSRAKWNLSYTLATSTVVNLILFYSVRRFETLPDTELDMGPFLLTQSNPKLAGIKANS